MSLNEEIKPALLRTKDVLPQLSSETAAKWDEYIQNTADCLSVPEYLVWNINTKSSGFAVTLSKTPLNQYDSSEPTIIEFYPELDEIHCSRVLEGDIQRRKIILKGVTRVFTKIILVDKKSIGYVSFFAESENEDLFQYMIISADGGFSYHERSLSSIKKILGMRRYG